MNLNTKTRSSTLCANARTVLDLISLNFQRQPKKPPPTSSFREEDVAKLCCLFLLNGNRISQQRKVNVVTRRWREHFPTPPSPFLPPLCNPQPRCRSFPALLQLALVSLGSRIKPLLEMRLEALEHLFFYAFDVGEEVPTSDIAVFTVTPKMNSSTSPRWSRYFSRRCCLQMSAVCFCRFLVPNP